MRREFLASLFVLLAAACASEPTLTGSNHPWQHASPESRGLDSVGLAALIDAVHDEQRPIHHMQLIVDGAEVLRADFFPYSSQERHDLASVTKSVTATLVGIALDRGYLSSVHQTLVDFFPERTIANLDDFAP